MDVLNIATYATAITAVGGPILAALIYIAKKGGPFVKIYFDKLILKLDEVVEETKQNSKNMNGHLEDSERHRRAVELRFESTLQEVKDIANLAYDNRDRITALELRRKEEQLEEERKVLNKDRAEFKKEEC